jgi:UDP-glucuronate decarboxylase
MDYRRQHGLSIRIARIFNTYGPRMHPADGRVVSNFMVQALRGEPLTLYGDGSQTRSFCYVDDMIDAVIRLMNVDDDPGGPVNLGNPHEVTMGEIARRIVTITGSASPIELHPLPTDDPWHRQPDISRARELLDWQPRTSLGDGLLETAHYFRARMEDLLSGETHREAFNEDERLSPGPVTRASHLGCGPHA